MNNDLTSFHFGLLYHLGVSNIRATGEVNKNGLRKSTIIGYKQLQEKRNLGILNSVYQAKRAVQL